MLLILANSKQIFIQPQPIHIRSLIHRWQPSIGAHIILFSNKAWRLYRAMAFISFQVAPLDYPTLLVDISSIQISQFFNQKWNIWEYFCLEFRVDASSHIAYLKGIFSRELLNLVSLCIKVSSRLTIIDLSNFVMLRRNVCQHDQRQILLDLSLHYYQPDCYIPGICDRRGTENCIACQFISRYQMPLPQSKTNNCGFNYLTLRLILFGVLTLFLLQQPFFLQFYQNFESVLEMKIYLIFLASLYVSQQALDFESENGEITLSQQPQKRFQMIEVKFKRNFTETPKLIYAITELHADHNTQILISPVLKKITTEGFYLQFGNLSSVFTLKYQWLAYVDDRIESQCVSVNRMTLDKDNLMSIAIILPKDMDAQNTVTALFIAGLTKGGQNGANINANILRGEGQHILIHVFMAEVTNAILCSITSTSDLIQVHTAFDLLEQSSETIVRSSALADNQLVGVSQFRNVEGESLIKISENVYQNKIYGINYARPAAVRILANRTVKCWKAFESCYYEGIEDIICNASRYTLNDFLNYDSIYIPEGYPLKIQVNKKQSIDLTSSVECRFRKQLLSLKGMFDDNFDDFESEDYVYEDQDSIEFSDQEENEEEIGLEQESDDSGLFFEEESNDFQSYIAFSESSSLDSIIFDEEHEDPISFRPRMRVFDSTKNYESDQEEYEENEESDSFTNNKHSEDEGIPEEEEDKDQLQSEEGYEINFEESESDDQSESDIETPHYLSSLQIQVNRQKDPNQISNPLVSQTQQPRYQHNLPQRNQYSQKIANNQIDKKNFLKLSKEIIISQTGEKLLQMINIQDGRERDDIKTKQIQDSQQTNNALQNRNRDTISMALQYQKTGTYQFISKGKQLRGRSKYTQKQTTNF